MNIHEATTLLGLSGPPATRDEVRIAFERKFSALHGAKNSATGQAEKDEYHRKIQDVILARDLLYQAVKSAKGPRSTRAPAPAPGGTGNSSPQPPSRPFAEAWADFCSWVGSVAKRASAAWARHRSARQATKAAKAAAPPATPKPSRTLNWVRTAWARGPRRWWGGVRMRFVPLLRECAGPLAVGLAIGGAVLLVTRGDSALRNHFRASNGSENAISLDEYVRSELGASGGVSDGQTADLSAAALPPVTPAAKGWLLVRSYPWSHVAIDGGWRYWDVWTAPHLRPREVEAGVHRLELSFEDGGHYECTVEVQPDRTTVLSVNRDDGVATLEMR